jgi:hypothetical protein
MATPGVLQASLRIMGGAIFAFLLAACDPAYFLLGTNESDTTVRVRVSRPGFVDVYELPAGFDGVVDSSIGTSIDADVTVLRSDCSELGNLRHLDQRVALIRIDRDLRVSIGPGEFPDGDPRPFAEEVRGECGSTKPPE